MISSLRYLEEQGVVHGAITSSKYLIFGTQKKPIVKLSNFASSFRVGTAWNGEECPVRYQVRYHEEEGKVTDAGAWGDTKQRI